MVIIMRKYIGKVDQGKMDTLMIFSRRLNALKDLKSTIMDIDGNHGIVDYSMIDVERIDKEINCLTAKKEKKLEEIRLQKGWSDAEMARIHLMVNYKAYMDQE